MASSIASLFGPTAEELMYSQQESMKQQQQQQLQQNLSMQSSPLAQQFYQSGYNIASGIGGMFGDAPMADPRLAQSIKARKIMSDIGVEDLNDPGKLKMLQNAFSEAGMPEASLYFADRGNAIETQERDYALEVAKATAKGAPDAVALNTFLNQVEKQLGSHQDQLGTVAQARNLLKLSKAPNNNENAKKLLDRLLIGLTKDSQIGQSELQNFVGGGSIGERVSNGLSVFFTGNEAEFKNVNKEDILNVLEVYHSAKLQEKGGKLNEAFVPFVTPSTVDSFTVSFDPLSEAANGYLEGVEKEGGRLGSKTFTVTVDMINPEDLQYLNTTP